MAIANIALNNTFTEWFTRDNQMAVELNRMLEGKYVTSGNITITNATTASPYTLNVVGITKSTSIELGLGSVSSPVVKGPPGNNAGLYFPSTNTLGLVVSSNDAVRITTTGNVGIGTTSPSQKLDVLGRANITGQFAVSGNVGVNKLEPAFALDVVGDIWASGNITMESDARVKDDIEQIEDALSLVKTLTGVSFTRKTTQTRQIGLIAQDVKEKLPLVVSTRTSDGYLGINYGTIVALLIEAIKELEQKVSDLEQKDK